jgi:hypothetical protein
MGFHAFSLDPRTVLGVGPDASMEEIHEAFRAKSKKYHPDLGGDEWAFRVVARAYEILKAMSAEPAAVRPWERAGADVTRPIRPQGWTWSSSFDRTDGAAAAPGDPVAVKSQGTEAPAEPAGGDRREPAPAGTEGPVLDPIQIRTVEVELIWTRFERDAPAPAMSAREADEATLSICMVIAWPPAELVDHTADFPDAAETLRGLIDLFEGLRAQNSIVAARSRLEDGRFVGWLSYIDVLAAQDSFFQLRESLRSRGLTVKLRTRDERVPFDWYAPAAAPVMSAAG